MFKKVLEWHNKPHIKFDKMKEPNRTLLFFAIMTPIVVGMTLNVVTASIFAVLLLIIISLGPGV